MTEYLDTQHDIDSCEDVWNGFHRKVYPPFFGRYLDFSKLEDKKTSIKCKRWYVKLRDDIEEKKIYPNFKMAGDCIFNFNAQKERILRGYIGDDKDGVKMLRYCVEHHHTYLNFSFMPITGGMNNSKGRQVLDRPEVHLKELYKYYKGENSGIFSNARGNKQALIWYLSWFDGDGKRDEKSAKQSFLKYMKVVYLIDDEEFIYKRLLPFAAVEIKDKQTAMQYMSLAKEFWIKRLITMSISLATTAYNANNQTDKNGQPYITHPLRVMGKMETTEEKIVAVLHDVLEDCPEREIEVRDLIQDEEIWTALQAITRQKSETYFAYINRVKTNPLATKVKIADLQDNLSRPGAEESLYDRYRKALSILTT